MSEQEDSQLWQEFKEMLNNSPYGVMKTFQAKDNELQELRAWKEKARPFIEERLEFLQNCLEEASVPIDEGFEVELKELEELSELTELLGGK